MLTYHEVMTVRLGALTTAATDWDAMAGDLQELERLYKSAVESVANDGQWVAVSADAAASRFAVTRKQFADAQVEARAIASLLRDAHGQFTTLIRDLEDIVEQAAKAGFYVNSQGKPVYDYTKIEGRNDPDSDYQDQVAKVQKAEAAWTKKIKGAVQAVDDADQGVKLVLRKAAGVRSLGDILMGHEASFNGSAGGDIQMYEAREAKKYADRLLAGEELDSGELEEWRRLLRVNSDHLIFSRTLLDSLGPEKALELSDKIDELAYYDDTKNKKLYLGVNGGLSDSLATATRVPDFKDAKGNHLRFGTEAYNKAFAGWKKTDDADFYNRWREAFREQSSNETSRRKVTDKQTVNAYQSLATLMLQGHGYSPQFVADVTDDMIAAEKGNSYIFHLRGKYSDENGKGWFANDPIDAALEVMSRDPEGAAGYLDPGTTAGKERFDYLLGDGGDSRDWNVIDTKRYVGDAELDADGAVDTDDRKGLGDALTAAATGVSPSGTAHGPTGHTDVNNRTFKYALKVLSGQGDDMPASLRDDMAKIFTNHGSEVLVAMRDYTARPGTLDQDQVMEVTKQISRSQYSYGLLHEGMNYAIVNSFYDKGQNPEDTLSGAGMAIGFMEQARYSALKGDQYDYSWDKMGSYHISGAILNFIPGYGDIIQRGADIATSAWVMDEQAQQAEKLTGDYKETYGLRRQQLNALADQWYVVNHDWARNHAGYSGDQGIYNSIAAAANDGNKKANGLGGNQ
ncbi:hypothetical protein [Streptomyces palmae]|uniref:Uncharacterized protein n=1 Tax=Streptomyces palmae TaxID=1701085 RepID=A0A4Z0HG49_9ACTN|nr:hypothetical protein [Streptomyces palmae]TGB17941.1 hypothetical protein E4099_02780 [Streptomyces palmae]